MTDKNSEQVDALEVIERAAANLADKASRATNATAALNFATAANRLAEAYAWLRSTGQPH